MRPRGMPARYVTVDRETPMLLVPDLRDWVPADHLVHFVIDAEQKSRKSLGPFRLRQNGAAILF
jgi:hypothetical protein